MGMSDGLKPWVWIDVYIYINDNVYKFTLSIPIVAMVIFIFHLFSCLLSPLYPNIYILKPHTTLPQAQSNKRK